MTHVAENTTEKDREKSFRSLILTSQDRDSRSIVCITSRRAENIALYDEAPEFRPLPGAVDDNHALGLFLLRLASELLAHGRLSQLQDSEIIAADEPVPFEIAQPCAD